jgi:hypothetical protein
MRLVDSVSPGLTGGVVSNRTQIPPDDGTFAILTTAPDGRNAKGFSEHSRRFDGHLSTMCCTRFDRVTRPPISSEWLIAKLRFRKSWRRVSPGSQPTRMSDSPACRRTGADWSLCARLRTPIFGK